MAHSDSEKLISSRDSTPSISGGDDIDQSERSELLEIPLSGSRTHHFQNPREQIENEKFMHIKAEEKNKANAKPKRPYSTTSSVYAEHTISNPDNDQVIYCIAAILQAQIFDDLFNPDLTEDNFLDFNIIVDLPAEYGGDPQTIPENILNHETLNDLELREKLLEGKVPTVDTIYRFMAMMSYSAKYSIECNIVALIYINRMTSKNGLPLTMSNWRGLFVGAIILAQKVWDDRPIKTSSFITLLPTVSKDQLIAIEMKVFQALDYITTVKSSLYAKYYFELRELFVQIVGNDTRFIWNIPPLALHEGKKLELRSARRGEKYEKSTEHHKLKNNSIQRVSQDHKSVTSSSAQSTPLTTEKLMSNTLDDPAMISSHSRYVLS